MGKKKSDRAVKDLTAELERSQAKASRWKARAKALEAEAADSAKELRKLRKRVDAATSSPAPAAAPAAAAGTPRAPDAPGASGSPAPSWTVARLRTEARDRGIAGYSRKSKDELLELLGR